MDLKQIHELIKIVNKSNIGEISIEDKDGKVTIKQKEEHFVSPTTQAQQVFTTTPQPAAPAPVVPAPQPDNLITIKSPMIGTFYRRPSQDKPVLVEVGMEITPGKVVCIIEAMKLFNEIESEIKGTIALYENCIVKADEEINARDFAKLKALEGLAQHMNSFSVSVKNL